MSKKTKFIIMAVCIAIIAIIVALQFNSTNSILTISGKKVTTEEYRIYLYEQKRLFENIGDSDIWEMDFDGQSAETVAKQNAVDSLVYVKTIVMQAGKLKLKLTQEELAAAQEEANKFVAEAAANNYQFINTTVLTAIQELKLVKKFYTEATKDIEEDSAKGEFFNKEYSKWKESVDVKKDEDAIAAIEL